MYLFVIVIQNFFGGFVSLTKAALMCTCSVVGAITCLIFMIFLITGGQADLLFIVLFCIGFLVVYFIVSIIFNRIRQCKSIL
jgi:hypothetical protein